MPRAATVVGMRDVRGRFRRGRQVSPGVATCRFYAQLDGTRRPNDVAQKLPSEIKQVGVRTLPACSNRAWQPPDCPWKEIHAWLRSQD